MHFEALKVNLILGCCTINDLTLKTLNHKHVFIACWEQIFYKLLASIV